MLIIYYISSWKREEEIVEPIEHCEGESFETEHIVVAITLLAFIAFAYCFDGCIWYLSCFTIYIYLLTNTLSL